jgi:hypothetical protein
MGNEWTALANFWGSLALTFSGDDLELTSAEIDTIQRLRVNNLATVDPSFMDEAIAGINYKNVHERAVRDGEIVHVSRELYSVLRAVVVHTVASSGRGDLGGPFIVHESDLRDVMNHGIKVEPMPVGDGDELQWNVSVTRP